MTAGPRFLCQGNWRFRV